MKKNEAAAVLIVAVIAVVLVACGGAANREAAYLRRAKAYMAKEDLPKAEIELKNVLQINPKNAQACYLLANIEKDRGNYRQAFGYYNEAIRLQPDYPAAQMRLGTFYLLSGNLAKASQLADTILSKHPTNADGQLLKAAVLVRQGNTKDAIKEATVVLAADPSNYRAASLLAMIYDNSGNTLKGIAVLKEAIAHNPKNIPLRFSLIRLYAKNPSDYARAGQQFQQIIALEPKQLQPRVLYASFLIQAKQIDQAELVLRQAVQADPKDMRRHVVLANFLAAHRSIARAEAELRNTIQSFPRADAPRFALASLYEHTGAPAQAEAEYHKIISRQGTEPDGLRARDQLASLLIREGREDEGMKLVDEVLKKSPQDDGALLLKGTNALEHNEPLAATSAFRSILKDQPTSAKVLALLAQANLMNNAPDLARQELQRAVSDNPNDINARLRLAQFLMQQKDSGGALKQIHRALAVDSNNAAALQAEAVILVARKDIAGATQALQQLSTAYPKNPLGPYRLGQLYGSQKQYGQAAAQFELALSRAPEAPQLLNALVNTYVAQGMPMKAVARLQQQIKSDPNDAPAHELLGEMYMNLRKDPKAAHELRRAMAINPKWDVPYINLAHLDLSRGNSAGALALYRQGLQAIPGDQQLLLELGGYYQLMKDDHRAIVTYRSALKADPKDAVADNNLAVLLVRTGGSARIKEAQTLSAQLASSPVPAFLDTAGWVALKSGDTAKAITLLGRAVSAAPQVPIFQYHLGLAYRQKGDATDARIHLAKAAAASHFADAAKARAALQTLH